MYIVQAKLQLQIEVYLIKDEVQNEVRHLVLVLDSHKGSSIYELLCDVGEPPEASVVHGGVAVLIHKVHVRLVSKKQLHNLVGVHNINSSVIILMGCGKMKRSFCHV